MGKSATQVELTTFDKKTGHQDFKQVYNGISVYSCFVYSENSNSEVLVQALKST